MRRRRRSGDGGEGMTGSEWLSTYSDMVTLVLCFFVLLYTFSTLDVRKFQQALVSLQGAFGILPGAATARTQPLQQAGDGDPEQQLVFLPDLAQIQAVQWEIEQVLEEVGMSDAVVTRIEERGLVVRFTDSALFDSGRADLRPDSRVVLDRIAEVIRRIPNHVRVEGHTDDRPIHTLRFPTNWELSTARATAVIRHFIERYGLDPGRLSAAGYGEYRPIADNATPEGRQQNRRVDIVILFIGESRWEPASGGDTE
ncbi:MAG TPA: flagellar motor protein MotB [Bacillota bacterium]